MKKQRDYSTQMPKMGETLIFTPSVYDNESKTNQGGVLNIQIPGIVNRVWPDYGSKDDNRVNMTVFPDCGVPMCRTSVPHHSHLPTEVISQGGYYEFRSEYEERMQAGKTRFQLREEAEHPEEEAALEDNLSGEGVLMSNTLVIREAPPEDVL